MSIGSVDAPHTLVGFLGADEFAERTEQGAQAHCFGLACRSMSREELLACIALVGPQQYLPQPLEPARRFDFSPLDFVIVTAYGVNYRGRVQACKWGPGGNRYLVEYVDDKGDFKEGDFRPDELRKSAPP